MKTTSLILPLIAKNLTRSHTFRRQDVFISYVIPATPIHASKTASSSCTLLPTVDVKGPTDPGKVCYSGLEAPAPGTTLQAVTTLPSFTITARLIIDYVMKAVTASPCFTDFIRRPIPAYRKLITERPGTRAFDSRHQLLEVAACVTCPAYVIDSDDSLAPPIGGFHL